MMKKGGLTDGQPSIFGVSRQGEKESGSGVM